MARRMFSPKVTSTDKFLDMPVSARELYFQFGMNADDDGFITPKRIMRMIGASDDDLKILFSKGFVIPFQSGVIVIAAWRINNLIRKDWYQPTIYQDEKSLLATDNNGEYYLVNEFVNENVPSSLTQDRIGKDSIGKDRLVEEYATTAHDIKTEEEEKRLCVPYSEIIALYKKLCVPPMPAVKEMTEVRKKHIKNRWLKELPCIEAWQDYFEQVTESDFLMGRIEGARGCFKCTFDWLINQSNCVKVIENNYANRGN